MQFKLDQLWAAVVAVSVGAISFGCGAEGQAHFRIDGEPAAASAAPPATALTTTTIAPTTTTTLNDGLALARQSCEAWISPNRWAAEHHDALSLAEIEPLQAHAAQLAGQAAAQDSSWENLDRAISYHSENATVSP